MNTRILVAVLFVSLYFSSCSKPDQPPKDLTLDLGNNITMKLVRIPSGKFLMGSPEAESDRDDDEGPQREVTISKQFYIGIYEVSQSQWYAVMGSEPWKGRWYCDKAGPGTPVCCLDWNDANKFCEMLSKKTGKKVVLPTEAQWEYACRAGTGTEYHFGDDASKLGDYAWFDKNASNKEEDYPHIVGQKKPSVWGLYDMHGNVWEWCRDWYDPKYYTRAKDVDPENTTEARYRVLRGGSWLDPRGACRAATRVGGSNSGGKNRLLGRYRLRGGFHSGFRVVIATGSEVE